MNARFGQRDRRWGLIIGGLIGLGFGWLYSLTKATGPTGFGDSDELIGIARVGGLVHAPGYPLFTLLLWGLLKITAPANPAAVAHFTSVVGQALTLAFIWGSHYLLVTEAFSRLPVRGVRLIAAVATIWLGLSSSFWLQANYLEVFPLNNLLVAGSLWSTLTLRQRWIRRQVIGPWQWLGYWALIGLMLSHQQLSLLVLPGILIWWWPLYQAKLIGRARVSQALAVVGILISGWLIGIWAWGQQEVAWHWQADPTLTGIVGYSLRQPFSGLLVETGEELRAFIKPVDITQSLTSLDYFLGKIGPLKLATYILLVGLIGMIGSWRKLAQNTWWGLLVMGGLSGPLIVLLTPLPSPSTDLTWLQALALGERLWQLGYMMLSFWLGLGLAAVVAWCQSPDTSGKRQWWLWGGVVLIGAGSALYLGWRNYDRVNLAEAQAAPTALSRGIEAVDDGSLIICGSDISCFGLGYLLATDAIDKELEVLAITPQMKIGNSQPVSQSVYRDNPFRIIEAISQAYRRDAPIYILELPEVYFPLLGLNGQAFWLRPSPLGLEVVCRNTPGEQAYVTSIPVAHRYDPYRPAFAQLQERLIANQWHTSDIRIEPTDRSKCLSAEEHLSRAREYLHEQQTEMAYLETLWASIKDPYSLTARIQLAEAYERNGYLPLAQREYQRAFDLSGNEASLAAKVRELPQLPPQFD